jgi:hypothetical protein
MGTVFRASCSSRVRFIKRSRDKTGRGAPRETPGTVDRSTVHSWFQLVQSCFFSL